MVLWDRKQVENSAFDGFSAVGGVAGTLREYGEQILELCAAQGTVVAVVLDGELAVP